MGTSYTFSNTFPDFITGSGKRLYRLVLVVLVSLFAAPMFSWAQTTVSLTATADANIWNNNAGDELKNYGACATIYINGPATTAKDRPLVRFDLSSIPAGAVITNAVVRLTKIGGATSARSVSMHRVTADWTEGTGGCAGTTGVCNWQQRLTGTNWTTPGGDFDATATATLSVAANATYDFDATSLVQGWKNGSISNFGVIFKFTTENLNSEINFASAESTTATDRPQLIVTYQGPTFGGVFNSSADDLIGQYTTTAGFTANYTQSTVNNNNGSAYALGLNAPFQYVIDAVNHRAFLVDFSNNRVLVFNLNASNVLVDKTPDFVLGQANFTSTASAVTQSGLSGPVGAVYDPTNNRLFVSQPTGNRVSVFDVASITNGENAVNVLGQTSFTASTAATTQAGLNGPNGLAYDAANNRLFVSQQAAHRISVFDVATITNGQNAVNVLGQSTFTGAAAATTSTGLNTPNALLYDATNNRLYVSDSGNNRVLVYNVAAISNGEAAINVLGQSNFTSSTAATTQAGMNSVSGLALDATNNRLFVSQQNANRVTVYNVATITDGENAIDVLGQPDYTTGTANTSQSGINGPRRITYDAANMKLYIADNSNNRVIIFDVLAPLSVTGTQTNVACFGGATGSINITAAGGTSPYTYNWGGGVTSEDRSGLVAGTYTVTVTDANTATATASFTITQPTSALSVTGTQVNVACRGASTGSINITAAGGTGAYNYNWGGGVTTEDRTGLAAGTYTVTVTDANLCTATASFTIGQPAVALTVTGTQVNVTCRGASTGSINITAAGGTGAYTYNWGGGITTEDRTGLAAGTYTVTVTDANLCTATASFTITQPAALSVTSTQINVSCGGTSNGSIDITAAGGTPPYTYNWGGGITTEDRTGLAPGTYTVTVTDACSATATTSATISISSSSIPNGSPAADLIGQYTTTAGFINNFTQSTANNNNGSVYALGFGNPTDVEMDVVNHRLFVSEAGNNRVLIFNLDASNNLVDKTPDFVLGQPNFTSNAAALTSTGMSSPIGLVYHAATNRLFVAESGNDRVLVFDVATITNGEAAVNVLGQANFTSNVFQTTQTSLTDPAGMDLNAAGTLLFVAEDFTNRVIVFDVTTITNGEAAVNVLGQANFTSNAPATTQSGMRTPRFVRFSNNKLYVSDSNNARILVFDVTTITDGEPAINVLGQPNFTSATLATTQAGLSTTMDLVLDAERLYVADFNNTRVMVFDVATITNGENAVNVLGQPNFTSATPATTQSGLANPIGLYYNSSNSTLFVSDYGNNRIMIFNGKPILSVNVTNAICGNNGTIDLTVAGGTSPYTYNWGGGITTEDRTGLTPGTYTVTVTEVCGNTATISATLTGPSSVLSVTGTQVNVSCFGASTGSINITAAGGTSPYTYNWGGGVTSQNRSSLAAGTYTVTVTDVNSCTKTATFTITQPGAALTLSPAVTQPSCFAFGSIAITPNGGTAPYTFDWADIPGSNNTQHRSGLSAGTYSVTATDFNGCTVALGGLTLGAPTGCAPVTVCQNNTASVFSVAPDPSNSSYTWTVPSGAIIVSGQGTPQITINWSGVTPGTHQVCVTAMNVCGTSAQTCQDVNVVAPPAPAASVSLACAGGTIQLSASGGGTYLWSGPNGFASSSANPTIPNASAATHNGAYTVTVTNTAGCTASATVNVAVKSTPQLSVATTNASCGQSNGAVDLTVTSGTPTYTYIWTNSAVTQDISGLSAGTYQVTVTDAAGCTQSIAAAVSNVAPGPVVTAVPTSPACFGGVNGSVNATITGGTAPLNILWSNGATTEDITGVLAGNYNISVTDANGCTGVATVVVTQPTTITLDFVQTNVNCFGASTGSIDLSVSGGTGAYSYSWTKNGSAFGGNTQDLSGLGAGVYVVTVTDANSCTATTSVTITQPSSALSATPAVTNVTCNGGANGQIILTATGGTLPYSYAWTGPGGFTSTNKDVTNIGAGTYNVTITDNKGCTFPLTGISVTQPPLLAITSAIPSAVKCFGGRDGSINITVTGGTGSYTYAWSNGTSAEDPTGLLAGTYTVTVTDANGCTVVSGPISVTQPSAALTATATATNVTCFGLSTGNVNLSVNGGTTSYTYLWSNGAVTQNLAGVPAGTYEVTVTDANMCMTVTAATVGSPAALVLSGAITDVACNGAATGAINLTVTGGTGTYTYSWTGGVTTEDRTGLTAGTYTVTVTDGNSCQAIKSFTLTQPAALSLSMVNTNISCNGASDGAIDLSVSGGIAPYTYLWSNNATTQDISGLSAIVYTVTVTDANNCTAVRASTAISQPAVLSVVANLINNVTCKNGANGSATAVPTGGTGPYTYQWSNGSTQQTPNNFSAGTYTVTATDSKGCTATNNVTITEPATGIVLNAIPAAASACGGNTGSIDLIVTNGVSPFSYAWTGPTTIGNIQDPSSLAAGTYNVTVSDAAGCSATLTIVVPTAPALVVTVAPVNSTCQGSNGEAYATVTGGVAPYTYLWAPGGATTSFITGLSAGTYTVTVRDANNCVANGSGTLTPPTNCLPPVAVDDNYTTTVGVPVSGTVATNDSDPDNLLSELTFLPLASPSASQGTIVWDNTFNGSFTFTPAPGFYGVVAIPYQVCDPANLCATAVLYITVNNTFAQNDINQTPINVPVSGNVLTNDSDPQGNTQTVTSALADTDGDGQEDDNLPIGTTTTVYGNNNSNAVVVAGTVRLNANGTFTFTPALNFTGDVPFSYTITDNNASPATDAATVSIEVVPSSVVGVNEPPVANDDTNTTELDVNVSGNVLPNDRDPDGDAITVTSALADTNGDGQVSETLPVGVATFVYGTNISGNLVLAGEITLNANGTYTFDPAPTFVGEVPVQYTISDPGLLMDAAILTITVTNNLGNATYANDDANVGPQSVVQTGNVLANDSDPEGNTQTVTAAVNSANTALVVNGVTANTLPSGGTLVIAANGAYTYTPALNFVGTEIVRYTASDNGSPVATDVATLYLTTLPLNNTYAQNDINQTPVNVPASGNVLTNDNDPQGNLQTVTSARADTDGDGLVDDNLPLGVSTTIYGRNDAGTLVVAGTVTLNSNGTYTYTPALNFTGDVPFEYTITDNNPSPATDKATVNIKVVPVSIPGVNEPPVANDDTNTTEKDVNVSGNVLPNDKDPDGDPITVTSALGDTDGDGQVDDPLTVGTATPIYGTNAAGATVPAGTITLNANGTYTFDPLPTFTGEVPVRYTISDPGGLTDAANLTITVTENLGNATYANDDANVGPQNVAQTGNVLLNDSDPEGNTQTVTAIVNSNNSTISVGVSTPLPSGGTIILAANGAYTYTPATGFVGTEIIRYTVSDNGSPVATDVATLYLTTLPQNTTYAQNDINQTPINIPVGGNVLTNDSDPQGNAQTVISALADTDGDGAVDDNLPLAASTTIYGVNNANAIVVAGTVTLNANGTYTYTPALNFQGTTPFAYTITDNNTSPATASATVAIEVIPASIPGINEPPVANDDTNTTEQDVNVSGNVLPNDTDPDGDVITVTSALADTDGDGQVDDPLTVGTATPISGTNASGATVPAGTITLNSNGTYTFDPLPNFIGTVPVRYTISDPGGLTDAANLTISVIPNLANITAANDDANVGPQGQVQTGNVLANDFDSEGNTQTVSAAVNSANTALVVNGVTANALPSGGTLIIGANGAYTYTPAANFVGTEIVRYTITDNGSPVATDVATLYLTTLPQNNTYAQNDINQTPINTPVGGNVLSNDSDPQGNTQTVTSALADTDGDGSVDDNLPLATSTTIYGVNNANAVVVAGTVTLNSNGTYTYTPALNFQGTTPFAYTITDNNTSPATASATVAIEVVPASVPGVNEPPVANDDTNTTEQDVNVTGFVLPNDKDPDGDVITVTSALADTDGDGQVDDPLTVGTATPISGINAAGATVPAGTITLNANGSYTFDPLPNFIGSVPVRYTISDPGGLTDAANLTISVIPNLANVTSANDDANVGPQGAAQTGNVLQNDFDPEGNTQTVTAAVNSANTALVVNGVTANALPSGGTLVVAANGAYTYTPAANFVGTEIVRYTITDNGSPVATDVATLYLTTLPLNNTYAQNDINQTPVNTPVGGNVLTNDNDPQGNTQTVTSALADTDGDGAVDDNLPLATSTTIYGVNNANAVVVAGTITLNANGTYTYTPALNFQGTTPFAYTITDNNANPATATATVAIEVVPASVPGVNEPPVANDDTNTTEQDVNVGGNVLSNDKDPDGDAITVTSALADTNGDGQVDDPLTVGTATPVFGTNAAGATVAAGTITLNSNGVYFFDPLPTFIGSVPVRYTISDPGGLTDAANLTISVVPNLTNVTVANDDANVGPQGAVQTGNVRTNDFDPEGNTFTVTSVLNSANTALVVDGTTPNALPSGGALVIGTSGSYTYTPAAGFVGTEIVRYTITDNGSPVATDVAVLYLTTLPVNNTLAQNDINQTPINTPVGGNVLTNDNDPQGNIQTVTSALADTDGDGQVDDVLALGSSTTIYGVNNANVVVVAGTVTLNANGTYTYTPALNFQGTTPFAYTVTDNNASPATASATVAIEVVPSSVPGVNEPPVANDDTNTTELDVTVNGNVLPNDHDPDGDIITVSSALADIDGDGQVDDPLTVGPPTPIYGTNASGATVPAGSISLSSNGVYTFDPLPTFTGTVPVRYTISDPGGLTDAATLTISVIPNLANVTIANDDANVGPQGAAQTGNILTNDFDPEGNTQTVTAAVNSANTALVVNGVTANTLPSGGTLVLAANGAYTYTPATGFVGTEIIRYTITDNGSPAATDVATLYLTTLPVNNTLAQNDINQTPINVPVSGNVLTNDSDPQGNTQTVTSALADTDGDGSVDDVLALGSSTTLYGANNANAVVVAGTVTLNANGTYTYTPALNFQGTTPFAYTITDNNASPATASATVAIEVVPASVPGVNEPPVANDDTNTTEQDVNVSGNVLPNDSDPDGQTILVTSALADTDGDGQVDDALPLLTSTLIYGTNAAGATVPVGTITLNSNGNYTFDPLPTFIGTVPVRYTISDPGGLTDAASLTISVIPNLGNVTVANDDANTGPQGVAQVGNILTNDFDPEGNTQTVTAAVNSANTALVVNGVTANALPSGGTLVIAANGTYTYTPSANFVGTEIVRYTITDNGSPAATDVATLYLTTLPQNNTYAQNDINQTPINVPVGGNVLTNDNDPQGNTQTVTSALADTDGDGQVDDNLPVGPTTTIYGVNNANNVVIAGTVMLNANGTYTFTPALNFQGTAPFAYTITDNNPNPATASATVAIEVVPASVPGNNEPPVANDDTNSTEQDVNVTGNVLPNDSDPDGNPITVTSALADTDGDGQVDDPLTIGSPTTVYGQGIGGTPVVAGILTLNSNGSYTLDPTPTFLGNVPVQYTISDPSGLTDNAVLTISVIANQGNVTFANDDANVGPQGLQQTGNVLTNDSDPEANTQTVTGAVMSNNTPIVPGVTITLPGGGQFTLNSNGTYTYTPVATFVGTEVIKYTITDNGSPVATDMATLYLTTLPVNNTLAQNDINQTPMNVTATGNVLTNDNDPQGNTQTVTSALADTDGDGQVDDNLPLGTNTTIYGTNNANAVVVAGTVTLNANGTYTYTPSLNFQGTTPFAYTITDNNVSPATASATVAIEVVPPSVPGVNEPPVANDDTNSTEQDVNVSGNVLPNDSDPDGNPITVTSALADTDGDGQVDDPLTLGTPTPIFGTNALGATVPAGTITLNSNGTYTFDPLPTFLGTVPVRYTISDPAGLTDSAVLTVTVVPNLGNVTFANDDANTGQQGVVQTGNVLTNDSDPEGNTQTVTAALNSANAALVVNGSTANTLPSGGTLVLAPNGVYTYTPAVGFIGTEVVRYTVTDNGSPVATDVAILYLTTLPLNNTFAQNDINQTPINTAVSGNVLFNDNDPQGNTQTVISALADTDGDGQVDDNLPLITNTTIYGLNDGGMLVVAGQVTLNAIGQYTFTPATGFTGTAPFAYTIRDNNVSPATDMATVTIEVVPVSVPGVSEPPVANDDTNSTEQDVNVTGFVLPNDTDPDGDVIAVTSALADTDGDGQIDDPLTIGTPTTIFGTNTLGATVPAGLMTLNANGQYVYDPTPIFLGEVSLIYTISDPTPLTDNAVLTITVTSNVGNVTYANDDANIGPKGVTQTGNLLTNDFDPEGNTQLVTSAINSSNNTLVVDGITANILPSGGTLVLSSTGGYVYTPAPNFTGTEIVRYTVTDNGTPNATDIAVLYLTTLPIDLNEPPVANDDVASTPEDTPVTIPATANDTDTDGSINPATLDLDPVTPGIQTTFTVPGQGTFVANPANGNVVFTPVLNFNGTTTPITYNVCDTGTPLPAQCDQATITVTVVPVNDPPVAVNDVATTPEDNPVTIPVTSNDTDVDGMIDPATLDLDPVTPGIQTTFTVPGQGTFVANPTNGNVVFTPVSNYSGTTTPITYSVCDNGTPLPAQCATATITVTVVPDVIARLNVKVLLQGALVNTSNGLMRDDLRAGGYLPLTEPYTAYGNSRFQHTGGGGGETTTSAVLSANAGTPNAIVDWVFVELRNSADPNVVVQTRSALVQRDGDVVSATDGTSMLEFPGRVGQSYFVSVKHRNHLGVMTASQILMTNDGTVVDFIHASAAQVYDRPGAINYNGFEQVTVATAGQALWAGNANQNTKVKYQGTLSDNNVLLAQVIGYPTNTSGTYNYNLAFGYFNGDINMDGKVKYQGTLNDANLIFSNVVGLYTLNAAILYNYDLFLEQTPN